ncbi:hypothetical protein [Runella limosa]|nr:hypothetical protein [Runella limosa]
MKASSSSSTRHWTYPAFGMLLFFVPAALVFFWAWPWWIVAVWVLFFWF